MMMSHTQFGICQSHAQHTLNDDEDEPQHHIQPHEQTHTQKYLNGEGLKDTLMVRVYILLIPLLTKTIPCFG